jgi:hypothetical protein
MPARWDTLDLSSYEKELDKILDDWIESRPEMDMAIATTVVANILIILLRDAPTAYKMAVLECIRRGERMTLQRDNSLLS